VPNHKVLKVLNKSNILRNHDFEETAIILGSNRHIWY